MVTSTFFFPQGAICQTIRILVDDVKRPIVKLVSIEEIITLSGCLPFTITVQCWKQKVSVYLKSCLRRESEESRCTFLGRKGACGEPRRVLAISQSDFGSDLQGRVEVEVVRGILMSTLSPCCRHNDR